MTTSCKCDSHKGGVSGGWIVDRFDDVKILRYNVDGFDRLSLGDKLYLYYLSQAALSGRDVIYDQNCRYNLAVRRTLEAMYEANRDGHKTDKEADSTQWRAFEKYLKKVWFANGVHHHYSNDKFAPEFGEKYFDSLIMLTPSNMLPLDYGAQGELVRMVKRVIFDPAFLHSRLNQKAGVDMLLSSACNYYDGVTQHEAETFYAEMIDHNDPTPVSYGLNSRLVKENGRIFERTWKSGGLYGAAIDKIVYWLTKASEAGNSQQKAILNSLIAYYRSGDLRRFDQYNVLWVKDTVSRVDFVNGFIEDYGDPLGHKASWEAMVNIKDEEATRRTEIISEAAQWFEDNSPIDAKYKKEKVKGVSAKVITAAILGGDCYPATPIGINLPNADWIRKEYGSKSVTIQNITHAYDEAARGNGFNEEFILRPEDIKRKEQYGQLAGNLHTDLHECLGHGSGKMALGKKGGELKNYGSTIEEARADLFGLYYIADPKMMELGVVPSEDVYKTEYSSYVMNGMMTQFCRIRFGKDVEEAHMRNRKLIAEWCYERGQADNVIEKAVRDGKTYIVVNDFDKLRALFGELLREVQRIKSEGDFDAARHLIETYAVKIDPTLHREVLDRYARLNIEPYAGFINPVYKPVMESGEIVDILVEYPTDYIGQMLEYSKNYSFLPSKN
ncbi:MAG: dihydrofolate reductase [Rikenellaceae bacterium]|jgi:dipeptidyl-peptidase-3|nr:dihydrofolate reductase [Rikenellaceae bacterium]